MARGDSLEDQMTMLRIRMDGLEKIVWDLQARNKDLLAENRKLNEPLRRLRLESKAMSAKARNAKDLVKSLQEANEINSTDT